jgi:hypothetical protein
MSFNGTDGASGGRRHQGRGRVRSGYYRRNNGRGGRGGRRHNNNNGGGNQSRGTNNNIASDIPTNDNYVPTDPSTRTTEGAQRGDPFRPHSDTPRLVASRPATANGSSRFASHPSTESPETTTTGLTQLMTRLFLSSMLGWDNGVDELTGGMEPDAFLWEEFTNMQHGNSDVRKPDQLLCPTCMKVHLPVEGSKKIEWVEEEGGVETTTTAIDGGSNEGEASSASAAPNASRTGQPGVDIEGHLNLFNTGETFEEMRERMMSIAVSESAVDSESSSSVDSSMPPLESDSIDDNDNVPVEVADDGVNHNAGDGAGGVASSDNDSSSSDSSIPPLVRLNSEGRIEVVDYSTGERVIRCADSSSENNLEDIEGTQTEGDDDVNVRGDEEVGAVNVANTQEDGAEGVACNINYGNDDTVNEVTSQSSHSDHDFDADDDRSEASNFSVPPLVPVVDSVPTAASDNERNQAIDPVNENEDVDESPPQRSRDGESDSLFSSRDAYSSSYASSSSSFSMPRLTARAQDSDDSDSDSSSSFRAMLPLVRLGSNGRIVSFDIGDNNESTTPEQQARIERSVVLSRFMHFVERRAAENETRLYNSNPTNPIKYLRDYGALRVFASATCPICLEDNVHPIVALKCGHPICEDDHRRLGGYLASEEERLLKVSSLKSRSAYSTTTRDNNTTVTVESNATERTAAAVSVEETAAESGVALQENNATHHQSTQQQTLSARNGTPSSSFRRRRSYRNNGSRSNGRESTAWAVGDSQQCDNANCEHLGQTHKLLWSINGCQVKYESCYPADSTFVADGSGGLWILKGRQSSDICDVLHKNKYREVAKFRMHKTSKIVTDSNGGVWAIVPDNPHLAYSTYSLRHFTSNHEKRIGSVPETSRLMMCRNGKAWMSVKDAPNSQMRDPFVRGLWLISSHVQQWMGLMNSYDCDSVAPDRCGNVWSVEPVSEDKALLTRFFMSGDDPEVIPFDILNDDQVVTGFENGVLLFSVPDPVDDASPTKGELFHIHKDDHTRQWLKESIGECSIEAKFGSDGVGGVWIMMKGCEVEDAETAIWRADWSGMQRVHSWNGPDQVAMKFVQG